MENLIEEAKRLKEQGQLDEAIATLKRAIDLNMDDAEAYLQLGLIYFERQDYAQAVKALHVAAGLRPSSGIIRMLDTDRPIPTQLVEAWSPAISVHSPSLLHGVLASFTHVVGQLPPGQSSFAAHGCPALPPPLHCPCRRATRRIEYGASAEPSSVTTFCAITVGSSCATAPDFLAAVRLVQAHGESVAALFSHRFPLTRAQEAIGCVADPAAGAVKVLITLGGDY